MTNIPDEDEPIVQWRPAHRSRAGGVTAGAGGALALTAAMGALAVGALAIGALAIGAVAIGRLSIGRVRLRRVEIDDLVVRRVSGI